MQRMTIKEWIEKVETDSPGMLVEDYRIYVVRDGETILFRRNLSDKLGA